MPDNLPELRDIHLPEDISIFPLAYGWWIIALCIIASVAIYQLVIVILQKSKKRYALKLLKDICCANTIRAAAEMSEILRRICIVKYPHATTLSGQQWLDFINTHAKEKLSPQTAELLLNAPYMPESKSKHKTSDIESLRSFCQKWIGENL